MKQIKKKVNSININSSNYLKDYLNTLGIADENISSFINKPRDLDEDNPLTLDNMQLAIETAYAELIKPTAHIFVQIDSDSDGYTSSAVLINYIKRRFNGVKVSYALHPGKEHGIVPEVIPEDVTLIFIPDAGSNDYDQQQLLCSQGKKLIILDHHEVNDHKTTGAILVNNQSSINFINKNLSGVGIVYMFIKAMDEKYFSNDLIYRDYMDLTAIGIIADAMNMTSLGNNYIAYYGLSNIKSKFIQNLAVKQARGIKNPEKLTKTDIAFYIAPVINGVIRSGSQEDKETVFKALVNNNSAELFDYEWRGNYKQETLYDRAVRLAVNAKSRQDSNKKKAFEWLCELIRKNNYDKDNLIIVPLDEEQSNKVSANITGLIAMEIVKEFNKPCLILRKTEFEDKILFGGSGRNGNFFGLPSLLDFLRESNLVYYVAGHANAFGCFIEEDKIPLLREYANTQLNQKSFEEVYEVDYWFHTTENINKSMLFDFASCEFLWGQGIPRPIFAFDFNYTSKDVTIMGADKSSVKIKYNGIDFVSFKNSELAKKIEECPNGHVQIIGAPSLNEWMGRTSIQIKAEEIEISELPKPNSFLNLI